MHKPIKQAGFSLIELLVAVVVFSVGLLAVAGLQTVSKGANFEGIQRTSASHIAFGMLEDMRSNGAGILQYLNSPDLGGGVISAEPAPNCSSMANVCSAEQKASHDLWFWESVLDGSQEIAVSGSSGGVISPTLCIAGPVGGGPGVYVVTIAWRGSVAMTGAVADPCGNGSGKYGSNNEFRRVVSIPTFIDPSI